MPIAYNESKRKQAFGSYTGCPCEVEEGINFKFSDGRQRILSEYNEYEQLLQNNCNHYICKDGHIYSNDNPGIKQPLGQWRFLACSYKVDGGVCRMSLKDTSPKVIPEELQVFLDSEKDHAIPNRVKKPKPKKVVRKFDRYELLKKNLNQETN